MTDSMSEGNSPAVVRFWHNYLSILDKAAIPKKARPWYRRHAETYIRSQPDLKLAHHTPRHVDAWLTSKGRTPGMPEWQFRQMADALRLLFCELVGPPWAKSYDWYQWRAFAQELGSDHPTLLRDVNYSALAPLSNALDARFQAAYPEVFRKFVATVRTRQMAARTETTYRHWIARFCAFHDWASLTGMDGSHIGRYLEHLALERKVSAATQRVALNALVFLFWEVLGRDVDEAVNPDISQRRTACWIFAS